MLAPQGEYKRRKQACMRLWDNYDPDKQREIIEGIAAKQRRGEAIKLNPYFAIEDMAIGMAARRSFKAEPINYFGRQLARGKVYYKADYCGHRGLYTEEDVKAHRMTNVEEFART